MSRIIWQPIGKFLNFLFFLFWPAVKLFVGPYIYKCHGVYPQKNIEHGYREKSVTCPCAVKPKHKGGSYK